MDGIASGYSTQILSNMFYLAINNGNGKINIYGIRNYSLVSTLNYGTLSYINDLLLIDDDLLASSGYHDHIVRIWNLTTNTLKYSLIGHYWIVYGLYKVASDAIASGSADGQILVWNTTTGEKIRILCCHQSWNRWSLGLLSDGKSIMSGSFDKTIKFWSWIETEYGIYGTCFKSIDTGLEIWSLATINRQEFKSKYK